MRVSSAHESQKRASDPLGPVTDSCELPHGCWESNPDPLQEQPVLLTTEPSLQFLRKSLRKERVLPLKTQGHRETSKSQFLLHFLQFVNITLFPVVCLHKCLLIIKHNHKELVFGPIFYYKCSKVT